MQLLQLGDQISEAIMIELTQGGARHVGRDVAATDPLADLRAQALSAR